MAILAFASMIALLSLPACGRHQAFEATASPRSAVAPSIRSRAGALHVVIDAVMQYPSGKPEFAYDGVPGVAPTMRVRPGDTIFLTLHNRLPPTNFTPNAVNIHFHGIDASPNSPGDDVLTTLAEPGQTIHYEMQVPKTQQPGLYWYHPHSHGEAYWQVTSGMSGAIVVEGLTQRLPELAGLRQRLLVLRDVQDHPNIFGVPWYARKGSVALEMSAARQHGISKYQPTVPDDVSSGGSCSAEHGMHVTVEGTEKGTIPIAPGERQLLRVVNASASRIFDVKVDGGRLGLVAMDGYPIAAYPGSPHVVWVNDIVLPPAGRAEFVIVGQVREALLRSRCCNSGPAGDRDPAVVLAKLEPTSQPSATDAAESANSAAAIREAYPAIVPLGTPARSRIVTFSEDANGYYIDRQAFDMQSMKPMMTVRDGTLERWTIVNDTDEVHAFHIHQIHFAVVSVNGVAPALHFWQDTVLVPPQTHRGRAKTPGRIVLLLDFRNPLIRGVFPFHCHMLDHEDGGMMALVRVI